MARGDVSPAELFISVAALEPDPEASAAIAKLLHLGEPLSLPPPVKGGFGPRHAPERAAEAGLKGTGTPPRPARPEPPAPELDRGKRVPSRTEQVRRGRTSATPPPWAREPDVMSPPPEERVPPPKPDALFPPIERRAILGAAIAVAVERGDLDIDRVVDRLCTGRPLDRLPQTLSPTLSFGAQVLLDWSEAMTPYADDRRAITEAIADVVGKPRVSFLNFSGNPLVACGSPRKPRRTWKPWQPPAPGTAIVIVSGFGLDGTVASDDAAPRDDWLRLKAMAREAHCPVVAFVPFGPHRWDRVLASAITMIHWDRGTSTRDVRRAVTTAPRGR